MSQFNDYQKKCHMKGLHLKPLVLDLILWLEAMDCSYHFF
jgi:hypothetical protein